MTNGWLLAVIAASTGCGHPSSKEPVANEAERCRAMATHNMTLSRQARERDPDPARRATPVVRDERFERFCIEESWPRGALDCFLAARDMDAWSACVTPTIRERYDAWAKRATPAGPDEP